MRRPGLRTLQQRAAESTAYLGHRMRWSTHHGEGRTLRIGVCTRCAMQVTCNARPDPNGIDIGGEAVAVGCAQKDAPLPDVAPYSRISRRPLPWQVRGLQYTASGYGRKIPTRYVIQRANERQWRRVYLTIYSNSGTCWIRVGGVDFAEVLPDYRVPAVVPDWPASVPVWDAAVPGSGGGE